MADGVQTSSEELARRWQQRGARRVAVFRNHLPGVAPLPNPVPRPLTVGWAGSPGHFADRYQVAPLVQHWMEAYPDVNLAVMSHEAARPFVELPPERYVFTPFGTLADYLRFLRSVDIGLAPILPTDYNRCRSDVKFLEYASQGVVGIYADLEPYRATVVPGETGLLYHRPSELIECLDHLHADGAPRDTLRQRAHAYVARHRQLSDHIGERLTWYRGLLAGPPQTHCLPDEIGRSATADGRYLQLRPQEPEQALMAAVKRPRPSEATSRLAELLQRHPDYLMGLQTQGKLLNDERDHRAALQ